MINEEYVEKVIKVLERQDLEVLHQPINILDRDIGEANYFQLLKIKGIARFKTKEKSQAGRYLTEDVITGLYGQKSSFAYLILGEKRKVNIYLCVIGAPTNLSSMSDTLQSSLRSAFPNIDLQVMEELAKSQVVDKIGNSKYFGMMTGFPTAKIGSEEFGVEQIERLLRGLYGEEYGYMVIAKPIPENAINDSFSKLAKEIKDKSSKIKKTSAPRGTILGEEILNRDWKYYIDILEGLLERFQVGKSQGVWKVATYFFSENSDSFNKMKMLLKSIFTGEKSFPQTIRTLELSQGERIGANFSHINTPTGLKPDIFGEPYRYKFLTVLNSKDLSTLVHLPKEEMPGYNVRTVARFGVDIPTRRSQSTVSIGEVVDRGTSIGNQYRLQIDDLVKHGLIVGVTGSGKTNTLLYILMQLWRDTQVPFLVIESAKSEYRRLMFTEEFKDIIRVFTLGNENISPFRLNPFEILEGVSVQTHVDGLKSVFYASFILYGPMPYILEQCIHEVYEDKGWDLSTGKNILSEYPDLMASGELYPTLTDLYNKIDEVVLGIGYAEELSMDIRAALRTRVNSLRIGGKGEMLDTKLSIPMEEILSNPTVLELKSIGDDEEKAFIIGLLLMRLYEYRELQNRLNPSTEERLKHITVLEEAHRLLKNIPLESSNLEAANTKGKAVETFCNIISEVRAYGEGILIADQVPAKLAPDAIKNTNLKIMHRIVARDDRDIMGDTMNLTEDQRIYTAVLDKGYACIYAEGLDESVMLKVPKFSYASMRDDAEESVMLGMRKFRDQNSKVFTKFLGCKFCHSQCKFDGTAENLLSETDILLPFYSIVLNIVDNHKKITECYAHFSERLEDALNRSSLRDEERRDIIWCCLVHLIELYWQKKRILYDLPLERALLMKEDLVGILHGLCVNNRAHIGLEQRFIHFQDSYKDFFSQEYGAFPECTICKNKCLYASEVKLLLDETSLNTQFDTIVRDEELGGDVFREALLLLSRKASSILVSEASPDVLDGIGLCYLVQKFQGMNIPAHSILNIFGGKEESKYGEGTSQATE